MATGRFSDRQAQAAIRPVAEWVKAEALLVEQMGQGTACGSVCFLPLALVMHRRQMVGCCGPALARGEERKSFPVR